MLHCLPRSAHDPFDRPILVIQASPDVIVDSVEPMILQTFERLRVYLQSLNKTSSELNGPILQYIILLDLKGVTFRNIVRISYLENFFNVELRRIPYQNRELITWTLHEVIPKFPGMLAGGKFSPNPEISFVPTYLAVLMINSTWVHSGMWKVVKSALISIVLEFALTSH